MALNKAYWEQRYIKQSLGWDIGYVSTPLKEYIDQLKNKHLKILIPGAGLGYEAVYLQKQGFTNITVVDIAQHPLLHIKKRCPEFPKEQLICTDFFDLNLFDFDLVLEQTFFCALPPEMRINYSKKMHSILREGGKIAGLLFNFPLTDLGPPFGGSYDEYYNLFTPSFKIKVMEDAYNSIKPRAGKELFFIFEK